MKAVEKKSKIIGLFLAVATLILTGCGKPVRDAGPFENYVAKFESYSAQYGKPMKVEDLIVKFGPLDDSELGVCTLGKGTPEITINEKQWKNLSDDDKEKLLLHEFGHCLLQLKHKNIIVDSHPVSLMIQWPQKITDYQKNKKQYLTDLFSGS